MPVEAPLVIRPGVHYLKNHNNTNRPESCIYLQLAPPAPTNNPVYSGYTTMPTASEGQSFHDFEEAAPHRRAPRWCDAETRHLLNIWAEEYPNIGRIRNAKEWERVSKKLNKKLSDNGMVTFRTAYQCKVRMKYLVDEYNRVRRQNASTDVDEVTCDYFNEIDNVLGDTPLFPAGGTVTNKDSLPVSAQKGENAAVTNLEHDENEDPSIRTEQSSDALATNDNETVVTSTPVMDSASSTVPENFIALDQFGYYTEQENREGSLLRQTNIAPGSGTVERSALPCSSHQEQGEKRERPTRRETTRKRTKKTTEAEDKESKTLNFLKDYLLESEKKDREFIMKLTQLDREREERGQEQMMEMMREIAKILKGDD